MDWSTEMLVKAVQDTVTDQKDAIFLLVLLNMASVHQGAVDIPAIVSELRKGLYGESG